MGLQTGQPFGNYRIVRLLGEGGFGEVYLAENPLIERRAAVKVLHAALAQDAELVRRFLNEARAASAIRHRNIIEVFDAGVTPEGAPYILMEFLEGASLQKRLADQSRLALPQALEIARQAGSALVAAHAAGIVHRDLKPENLFLVPEAGTPGGERVKVLDFGIAKIRSGSGTGKAMRTQAGMIMGSPAYMSPEQCKDSADVDLRSDIYSFATIIYEMLAGRTPHVAASGTEMLVMHLSGTPAPLREWAPEVPAHVEAAVMRALSRARADRFDSIASFVGALLGDAEVGAAALARPSPSANLPVVLDRPVSGAARTIAAQASTTFSRASGEVGVHSDDEVPLAVTRHRRWPIVAFGALVLAGLALFLLARPSENASPRTATGTPRVATAAANAGPVPRDPTGNPGQLAFAQPNAADAGVAPPAVAGASVATKPQVVRSPVGAGVPPARSPPARRRILASKSQTSPLPTTKKERSEEPWLAH